MKLGEWLNGLGVIMVMVYFGWVCFNFGLGGGFFYLDNYEDVVIGDL